MENRKQEESEIKEWERFCEMCGSKMMMNPTWKYYSESGMGYISKCSYICPNKKHFWDLHGKYTMEKPNPYYYD